MAPIFSILLSKPNLDLVMGKTLFLALQEHDSKPVKINVMPN